MELFCIKANPQWSTTPLTCPFMGSAEKTNVLPRPSRSGQHLKHHFHPSSMKRVPYTEAQSVLYPNNRVDPCTLKPLLPLSPVESLLEPSPTLLFSQPHGPTDTLNPASPGHKDRAPQTLPDLYTLIFPLLWSSHLSQNLHPPSPNALLSSTAAASQPVDSIPICI